MLFSKKKKMLSHKNKYGGAYNQNEEETYRKAMADMERSKGKKRSRSRSGKRKKRSGSRSGSRGTRSRVSDDLNSNLVKRNFERIGKATKNLKEKYNNSGNVQTRNTQQTADKMEGNTFKLVDAMKDHIHSEQYQFLIDIKKRKKRAEEIERNKRNKDKERRRRWRLKDQMMFAFLITLMVAYFAWVFSMAKNPAYKDLGWIQTLLLPTKYFFQSVVASMFGIHVPDSVLGQTVTSEKERHRKLTSEIQRYKELRDFTLEKIVKIETLQQRAIGMGSPTGAVTKETEKDLSSLTSIISDCDGAMYELNYGHRDITAGKQEFHKLQRKL